MGARVFRNSYSAGPSLGSRLSLGCRVASRASQPGTPTGCLCVGSKFAQRSWSASYFHVSSLRDANVPPSGRACAGSSGTPVVSGAPTIGE